LFKIISCAIAAYCGLARWRCRLEHFPL